MPRGNLYVMGCGILLILLGCALVGRRKTIKRKYMPGHVVAHRCLPMLCLRTTTRDRRGSIDGLSQRHQRRSLVRAARKEQADKPPETGLGTKAPRTFRVAAEALPEYAAGSPLDTPPAMRPNGAHDGAVSYA